MKKDEGWVCLWRKIKKSAIFDTEDEGLLKVFIFCLVEAAFQPHMVENFRVERGQFLCGRFKAGKECRMDDQRFRRKLLKLKELGIVNTIKIKTPNINKSRPVTLVTVYQYDSYQDIKEDKQPVNQTLSTPEKQTQHNNGIKGIPTGIPLEEHVIVKRKIKSKPREETRPLLDYFCNKYKERFGQPYHLSWAKDSTYIKRLLDSGFTATTLFKLIDIFLNDKDAFLTNNGHLISIFGSQYRINKYVKQLSSEAKIPSKPFDSRHIHKNKAEEQEKHRQYLLNKFEVKFGGKEKIPDDWWKLIYPDDATNPNRKH